MNARRRAIKNRRFVSYGYDYGYCENSRRSGYEGLIELETTSDKLEYEVVDKGSAGFLGIGAKPAIIRAKKKETVADKAIEFLSQIFDAMNLEVSITAAYNEEEQEISLNLEGEDMGILIGKRGQTLDSLQYR